MFKLKLLLVAVSLLFLQREWSDTFDSGKLDNAAWRPTSQSDFNVKVIDVFDKGKDGVPDFRLRLRADTMGTDDATVKYLGVRSVRKFTLRPGTRISAQLDWNEQVNGSYLSSALILSPELTSRNPLENQNYLKVEYFGVPPGINARMAVGMKSQGRENPMLFTEGWPETNRSGRRIQKVDVAIVVKAAGFEVLENDRVLFDSQKLRVPFATTYLYLQMSTHSNYRVRELFWDNIKALNAH